MAVAGAATKAANPIGSWSTLIFLVFVGLFIYLVWHWWKNRKNKIPIIASTVVAYERRKSLAMQSCSAGIRGKNLILSGDISQQGQIFGKIKGHLVLINQFTREADKRKVHLFFVANKVLMFGKTDLLDLLPMLKRRFEAVLVHEHDLYPQKKVRAMHIVTKGKQNTMQEGFTNVPQLLGNVFIKGVNIVPFGQFYSILNKDLGDREELWHAINSDVYVLHAERVLERVDQVTEKALLGSPDHQKTLELAQSGAGYMPTQTSGGGMGGR